MRVRKEPLIEILVRKYEDYSEKELYAMVMCGEISIAGETVRNPRQKIDPQKNIEFKKKRFVSRGGDKLEFALGQWKIEAAGCTVLDAGSSTGGFTDCLLKRGAAAVHSVDVGFNQLDYSLRTDSRVNVLEKTNIMSVTALDPVPDFAVADLSFRSITGVAVRILRLTKMNLLVALIKPQFEIDGDDDFDGVIRDAALLKEVVIDTAARLGDESVRVEAVLESPVKGGKGNTEFLFRLSMDDSVGAEENTAVVEKFFSNRS